MIVRLTDDQWVILLGNTLIVGNTLGGSLRNDLVIQKKHKDYIFYLFSFKTKYGSSTSG